MLNDFFIVQQEYALLDALGHWTQNEYQYIWQLFVTNMNSLSDEYVRVHITTGFHISSDMFSD